MIIKEIEIEKFRAFSNVSFSLGKRITAIAGRNATQKTTVLGMIGQPFTISKDHPMYGCKTVDGYNFRSQFREKFKISPEYDIIGEHKWKLIFHNGIYENNYYSVHSIPRSQKGSQPVLRFWNAESRARGAGFVQLPVYFLSLSRLFPIGETGKTKNMTISLNENEKKYCIDNYKTILSIQNSNDDATVGAQKGTASRVFAGVSDNTHDIFTNSAGEGNITKIILAVLSFKRLKEQYGKDYKGGILLIDELDATLYGYSQEKLVEYLWKSAGDYKIQIVFTTHSPIILKRVNKYQREEIKRKSIDLPKYAYDSSIVYLEPVYDAEGKKYIMPKNISTSQELNNVLYDINLSVTSNDNKLNVYCEDARAVAFVKYILIKQLECNLDLYMTFVDINLGWTNYVHLTEKRVPEFVNNIVILDGDVQESQDYKKRLRQNQLPNMDNYLFLPLVIEKDIFVLLKNHASFNKFREHFSNVTQFNYDICFRNHPLNVEDYTTNDFKEWYRDVETALNDEQILFSFWYNENLDKAETFAREFVSKFNMLADKNEMDNLPITKVEEIEGE